MAQSQPAPAAFSFAQPTSFPAFPAYPAFARSNPPPPSPGFGDRKRRLSSTDDQGGRKRPNLANGFSSLSISPRGESPVGTAVSTAGEAGSSTGPGTVAGSKLRPNDEHRVDDDDVFNNDQELRIEELPEHRTRHGRRPHNRTAFPTFSFPRSRDVPESSPSPSTDTSDSESQSHFPLPRRRTVYADEVEDPEAMGVGVGFGSGAGQEDVDGDVLVEDLDPVQMHGADWSPRRKLKRRTSSMSEGRHKKSKGFLDEMDMEADMDLDMVGAQGREGMEGMDQDGGIGADAAIEEIPRNDRPRRGRSRMRSRTQWHEPEKDRIIYTHLSSSPSGSRSSSRSSRSRSRSHSRSSSRSASPNATSQSTSTHHTTNPSLSQPGKHGFTISPSMLTRLLAAQAKQDAVPMPFTPMPNANAGGGAGERGLVLYRPLGIPPGRDWREVVEQWTGKGSGKGKGRANGAGVSLFDKDGNEGRFEILDEDESQNHNDVEGMGGSGGGFSVNGQHGHGGSEIEMDMDMSDFMRDVKEPNMDLGMDVGRDESGMAIGDMGDGMDLD